MKYYLFETITIAALLLVFTIMLGVMVTLYDMSETDTKTIIETYTRIEKMSFDVF